MVDELHPGYFAVNFGRILDRALTSESLGFGCQVERSGDGVSFKILGRKCSVRFFYDESRLCGDLTVDAFGGGRLSGDYGISVGKKDPLKGLEKFIELYVIPMFKGKSLKKPRKIRGRDGRGDNHYNTVNSVESSTSNTRSRTPESNQP